MIDRTDEEDPDVENPGEWDEGHLSWCDCPVLPRRDMLHVIAKCKGNVLGGEAINLYRIALTQQPRSGLVTHYVEPNLYHPGSHYIYTTPDPSRFGYKNWRPEITAIAIEHQLIAPCGLFSNTLAWIDAADLSPSDRTYNAGFAVYTIEFDGMPIDDQMRVVYSGKLKRIDAELSRYRDYRGYEVVYSGGKSLHFHFCFDLRHLKRDLIVAGNSSYRDNWTRDLPDCLLRPAYAANWDRLAAVFCDIAEIDMAEFPPDPRLRSWEQLRRCPWALRLVSSAHPLGLPYGHLIYQPVLASRIYRHAPRSVTEWFHDPDKLGELCRDEQVRRRKPVVERHFAVNSRELELFEQHAPEMFRRIIGATTGAAYPQFAGFEVNETGFRCYFYNGPHDHNPSSFCEGNRSRILLQGRHACGSEGITLAATPNQIFDWIVARSGDPQEITDDWMTRRYKAVVQDRESLARFLDDHMVEMALPRARCDGHAALLNPRISDEELNTHVLICGPQGCGKSTKMMAKIPAIYVNDPGVIYFSSPSIDQAEEKIETFRRVNQNKRFVPYLYLSLTALYEQFCQPDDRIDHLAVLAEGESSWLHAVYERQRDVYDRTFASRSLLFDLRDQGKIPILFGTHETMRQHASNGMTRIFYAGDFSDKWFGKMALHERDKLRNRLLDQNRIHRVIVDEVTAHDLVSIHAYEIVEWAQTCAGEIGFDQTRDIAERYMKFRAYLSAHPCDADNMKWDLFNEVIACRYTDENIVAVSDREVPFDEANENGIYRKMVGQKYYVRTRGWWNDFWRVAMLTTEAVPTRIVEALNIESASRGECQDDRFKVYEFDLPDSSRDIVTTELCRACKKTTLPELVRAYRQQYPQAEIITDMVKKRISEFGVTTHMSAKGSNAFIDKDIIAFYTNPSPALFGELGALNTRFGRSDLMRLFYVDQFDQTCGRNRGFRGARSRDHKAVFPPRLNSWLTPAMSGASHVRVMAKPSVSLAEE